MLPPFAAVLLAGGSSRRMGRDKALLPLGDGRLLWQRQLDVLRQLGPAELFVSGPRREGFPPELVCLQDEQPGRGPLGGIASALGAMSVARLVVLAIDLPLMPPEFLRVLLERAADSHGIVPRHPASGLYEPLAAVYPSACLALARARLDGVDWSLQRFVQAAGNCLRDYEIAIGEEAIFANWNEPTSY